MEKVVRDQGLALQQHFPYKFSKFSENSNGHINLLFTARGLKLGHLVFSMRSFHFWHSSSYSPLKNKNFLGKIWSSDPSCKGPIVVHIVCEFIKVLPAGLVAFFLQQITRLFVSGPRFIIITNLSFFVQSLLFLYYFNYLS